MRCGKDPNTKDFTQINPNNNFEAVVAQFIDGGLTGPTDVPYSASSQDCTDQVSTGQCNTAKTEWTAQEYLVSEDLKTDDGWEPGMIVPAMQIRYSPSSCVNQPLSQFIGSDPTTTNAIKDPNNKIYVGVYYQDPLFSIDQVVADTTNCVIDGDSSVTFFQADANWTTPTATTTIFRADLGGCWCCAMYFIDDQGKCCGMCEICPAKPMNPATGLVYYIFPNLMIDNQLKWLKFAS